MGKTVPVLTSLVEKVVVVQKNNFLLVAVLATLSRSRKRNFPSLLIFLTFLLLPFPLTNTVPFLPNVKVRRVSPDRPWKVVKAARGNVLFLPPSPKERTAYLS